MMEGQVRIVLRNAGQIDPANVYHYMARQGYTGLANVLDMMPEEVIKRLAQQDERTQQWTEGKDLKKVIYVPRKLVNVVAVS